MKRHVKVQLRPGATVPGPIPYWEDLIRDRALERTTFVPAVDAVFGRYDVPFFATREYRPAGETHSREEVSAGLDRIYRLILQREQTIPPDLVRDVELVPAVEYARVGEIGTAELPRPRAAAMGVETDRASRQAIRLPEAHLFSRGDAGITVAVLDTGVDLRHRELAHALVPGYDFVDIIDGADRFLGDHLGADNVPDDEVGHGTHVAGIIVGRGIAMPEGVAPECKLLPVRVLGALQRGERRIGAGLIDNINAGIKYAIDQGADVLNMSLGVLAQHDEVPHAEMIDYARRKGVTIVAASGNDGSATQRYYPAALPYVITVGAIDDGGEVAAFSTYGEHVDLVAPGTNIYSSFLDNSYAFSTGTSHATPFVAGGAALLKSLARRGGRPLADAEIKQILRRTADRLGTRLRDARWGSGILNLLDAVRLQEHTLRSDGEVPWVKRTRSQRPNLVAPVMVALPR